MVGGRELSTARCSLASPSCPLHAARTRIADLEQQNATRGERVRALTALVNERSLEADGKTDVIPFSSCCSWVRPPHCPILAGFASPGWASRPGGCAPDPQPVLPPGNPAHYASLLRT